MLTKYQPEIDGLRAIAVVSVIINHFNRDVLPSGHLGVDIFFVISGYVISASLHKASGGSFADLFLGFYVRRVKRLVPALVLCVLTTGIAICLFDKDPGVSLKTGVASLFGISNIYLWRQTTDYFGALAQLNVFTHTWSLGVEEQFYIFFPLIVRLTGFGRRSSGHLLFGSVIGTLAVGSLIAFAWLNPAQSPAAFFLMPMRFWELSVGCLTFVAVANARQVALPPLKGGSLVALVGLIGALFVPPEFSVYSEIAVVLLAALLIASICPQTVSYRLLAHPAMVYVGRISYSLYLWHWSVISISRWTVGIHLWSVPLQAALMLVLADLSYRCVENPMRRANWSLVRWGSIAYGSGALAAAAAVLLVLAVPLSGRLYTGKLPTMVAAGADSLMDVYAMPDGRSSWRGGKCILSDNRQVGKTIPVEECTLGDPVDARHRVLVLGNSFAAAFVQSFDQLVQSDKYSVTLASSWDASVVPEIPNTTQWNEANDDYWDRVVPSLMSRLRPGDSVFLANDMAVFSPENPSADLEQRLTQLRTGLTKLSDRLSERGIRLVVLHGNPLAREAACAPEAAKPQWFAPFGSPCHFLPKERTLARRARLDEVLSSLRDQGKIAVVDLINIFCPGEICTYEAADGEILYRDVWSHPSVEAARLSAPVIRNVLTSGASTQRDAFIPAGVQ